MLHVSPAGDPWQRRPMAWRLFGLLPDDEEVAVATVVELLGCCADSARDNLKYLASLGVVVRVDRFHWAKVSGVELRDEGEVSERRKARHCLQRESHRAWRASPFDVDLLTGEIVTREERTA